MYPVKNLYENIKILINGSLLSYPQVFFSKSKLFAFFILFITFIFPTFGLAGLTCTFSALLFAAIIRLHPEKIKTGYYGYNALLVGLGLGSYYEYNTELILILFFAGLFTLLIHVSLEGIFNKYRLPVLSLPFLLSLWIIQLATKNIGFLTITDRGIYILNNIFQYFNFQSVQWYDYFNNQLLPEPVKYFFISLGSIFFQDTALAGFFIFIGLLIFSRISASLAVIGFTSAYVFMQFMGINVHQFSTFFVGFNFILTAIALGGFFIIPSVYSYLWVILLTPLTVLLTLGFSNVLNIWQLSVYSLPFNFVVIMFIYILYYRTQPRKKLAETIFQEFMPEKNLYSYQNLKSRFGNSLNKIHIMLPFWGEWTVSQGYDGKITHKNDFRHALDFVITYNGKTYKSEGSQLEDYYCYNKLVISPGYGTVVKVLDGIDDNVIGDVNTMSNWGNTIVIKHADYLYSQLNHLKAGSIKIKEGDFVKIGQPLAQVGNSGRSPEPHLHFQFQSYPYIGSPTMEYPLARYLKKNTTKKELKIFSIPKENEVIENVSINPLLYNAFHFIPGQQIKLISTQENKERYFTWEVLTDSLNNTYIHCKTTNSYAYIYNNGLSHYFNSFYGDKKSPLYLFYLSCYLVELSTISNYSVNDEFPLHHIFPFRILFLHDISAPFVKYIRASYSLKFAPSCNEKSISEIELQAQITKKIFGKTLKNANASIFIDKQGIYNITFDDKQKTILQFIYKERFE